MNTAAISNKYRKRFPIPQGRKVPQGKADTEAVLSHGTEPRAGSDDLRRPGLPKRI